MPPATANIQTIDHIGVTEALKREENGNTAWARTRTSDVRADLGTVFGPEVLGSSGNFKGEYRDESEHGLFTFRGHVGLAYTAWFSQWTIRRKSTLLEGLTSSRDNGVRVSKRQKVAGQRWHHCGTWEHKH